MSSRETDGIIAFMRTSGVPHRVTATTNGRHSPGSYHYLQGTGGVGLAVDLAGPVSSVDSPALLAIYKTLAAHGHLLAELIYSGPGGGYWKHGVQVSPYATASHHNHVHVAVERGIFLDVLAPFKRTTPVPDDPNLPNIEGPLSFHPVWDSAGNVKGYYIFSTRTGELHAYGVPYFGRSEDVTP